MKVKKHSITTTSAPETVVWLEIVVQLVNIGCIEIFQRVNAQRPVGLCERRFAPHIKNVSHSSSSRRGQNLGFKFKNWISWASPMKFTMYKLRWSGLGGQNLGFKFKKLKFHGLRPWNSLCISLDEVVWGSESGVRSSKMEFHGLRPWNSLCISLDEVVWSWSQSRSGLELVSK